MSDRAGGKEYLDLTWNDGPSCYDFSSIISTAPRRARARCPRHAGRGVRRA